MEVLCRAEWAADPLPYEVAPNATAGRLLHDVCALFGREEEDAALEVDGVVAYVWGGDDVEAGSLGLHADSSVVVKRSRERVLEKIAKTDSCHLYFKPDWAMPEWVWDDLITMTALVKNDGRTLAFASERLKNTPSVVLEAIKRNGGALQHASSEMRNTPHVVLESIKKDAFSLAHASDVMKNTADIVLQAVKENGYYLNFASDELKDTAALVLAAVHLKGEALQHASNDLRNTPAIVRAAVEQDGHALEYASAEMRNMPDIVMAAVQRSPGARKHASDEMKVALHLDGEDSDSESELGTWWE